MGQAPAPHVKQSAGAQVADQRQAALAGETRQRSLGNRFRETHDLKVARMNFHDQRRARSDRLGIVPQVGAVGSPDLDQPASCPLHDLRHAELAADLDQFAPRHYNLAPLRQRIQNQQDGGGIVVHHRRPFCARHPHQGGLKMPVPVIAFAGMQIKLQIHGIGRRDGDRLHGFLGQQGAAEIRVQDGSCEIEHGLDGCRGRGLQPRGHPGGNMIGCGLREGRLSWRAEQRTQAPELLADRPNNRFATMFVDHRDDRRQGQDSVDGRDCGLNRSPWLHGIRCMHSSSFQRNLSGKGGERKSGTENLVPRLRGDDERIVTELRKSH